MKLIVLIVLILLLTGCASVPARPGILELPKSQRSPLEQQLLDLPPVDAPIMTVAVYSFADKTGQRKTADAYATFSSAVTQGAESWLIDALRVAGNGTWFKVLERASVQTGEVLLSVAVTKTITSVAVTGNLYKFYEHGTLPIEAEIGLTANEPNTIAVRSAIDQAVIEIVNQGSKSGLWKFKSLPIPTQ